MSIPNSNIPNDYTRPLDRPKFEAPAHHLNEAEREAVVEVAEQSHRDTGASSTSTYGRAPTTSTSSEYIGSSEPSSRLGSNSNVNANFARNTRDYEDVRRESDNYETSKTHQDTSNRAPNLGTDARVHQNEINAAPGVGDAAPKPSKANVGGTNHGSFPNTNTAGSDPAAEGGLGNEPGSEYPVQRHAGKVGYGPNYATGESLTDKIRDKIPGLHSHKQPAHADEDAGNAFAEPMKDPKRPGENSTAL